MIRLWLLSSHVPASKPRTALFGSPPHSHIHIPHLLYLSQVWDFPLQANSTTQLIWRWQAVQDNSELTRNEREGMGGDGHTWRWWWPCWETDMCWVKDPGTVSHRSGLEAWVYPSLCITCITLLILYNSINCQNSPSLTFLTCKMGKLAVSPSKVCF